MANTKLNSIEDLKTWWEGQEYTFWTLYRGHLERKEGSRILARNEKVRQKEEAFEMLEKSIEMQASTGGMFTIFATQISKGNSGFSTFLTIDDPNKIKSGIHGLPQHGIYGTASIKSIITEENAKAVKLAMLERDMEDMRADLAAKNSPENMWDKIGTLVTQDPESAANAIGALMTSAVGLFQMAKAQMGTPNSPPINGTPTPEVMSEEIDKALDKIEKHVDLESALTKFAEFVDGNPEEAKNFLNQI